MSFFTEIYLSQNYYISKSIKGIVFGTYLIFGKTRNIIFSFNKRFVNLMHYKYNRNFCNQVTTLLISISGIIKILHINNFFTSLRHWTNMVNTKHNSYRN